MGLIIPKYEKNSLDGLSDNITWFSATLIDFDCLSTSDKVNEFWKYCLNKRFDHEFQDLLKRRKTILKRKRKCSGRISVENNCIVFQIFNSFSIANNSNVEKELVYKPVRCSSNSSIALTPETPISNSTCFNFDSPKSDTHSNNNDDDKNNHLSNTARFFSNRISYFRSLFLSLDSSTSKYNTDNVRSKSGMYTFICPLNTIRHFGYHGQVFTFDTGRMSPTGECRFTFKIKNISAFLTKFGNQHKPSNTRQTSGSPISQAARMTKLSDSQIYQNITLNNRHIYCNINPISVDTNQPENMKPLLKPPSLSNIPTSSHYANFDNQSNKVSPNICYSVLDFVDSHSASATIPSIVNDTSYSISPQLSGEPSENVVATDTLNYLTISERQTRAVESMIKRIK